MVKRLFKLTLLLIFSVSVFIAACSNDLLGLFGSSDLDERLKSKDIFKFVSKDNLDLNNVIEKDSPYSFIVVSDTHIEDGNAYNLQGLSKVISDNQDIKFVIALGDITQYGAEHDIKKFIDICGKFNVPCYPVIGNHDFYFGNWSVWRDNIGSTSYKVSGAGTTLFFLDSANAYIGKKQLDWLDSEMKKLNRKERIFVFTHAPLFVKGPADMQQVIDIKERARIASILKDKCDIMFMGHLHKNMSNTAGGTRYVAIEDFKTNNTYCLVTVSPSGVAYKYKKL